MIEVQKDGLEDLGRLNRSRYGYVSINRCFTINSLNSASDVYIDFSGKLRLQSSDIYG